MYASSSYYTTTNPTRSSLSQYPVSTTTLFLRRIKLNSNFWNQGIQDKVKRDGQSMHQANQKFLTENYCELVLIEPHNHCVNAAKHAIQTFKYHFISALVTTNSKFPLQLWDKLTSQVKNTLTLMQASRIYPNILAYEAIWGPYDWNRFPLAPPGCKAVMQSRHLQIP